MPVILLSLLISLPSLDDGDKTPTRIAVEEAHQLLAGTWTVVSAVDDGERIGADLIKQKLAANGEITYYGLKFLLGAQVVLFAVLAVPVVHRPSPATSPSSRRRCSPSPARPPCKACEITRSCGRARPC